MNTEVFSSLDLNEKQFSLEDGKVHWTNPFVDCFAEVNYGFVDAFLKSDNPKKDYPNWHAFLSGQELVFNVSASFFDFEGKTEEDARNRFFESLKNLNPYVCSSNGNVLDCWHVEILSFPQKNDLRVDEKHRISSKVSCTVPVKMVIKDGVAPSENLQERYGDKSWRASFYSSEICSLLQWIRDYIEYPDCFYCYHYTSNDCLVLFKAPGESRDSMDAVIEDFVNHYQLDDDLLRSAILWSCFMQKGHGYIKDFLESESNMKSLSSYCEEGLMTVPLANTDMAIQLKVDFSRKDWYDAFLKNRERDVGLFTRSLGEFLSKGFRQRDEWVSEKVVAAIRKNPELFVNCSNARFSQFAKAVIACNAQNLSDEEYQQLYSPGKRNVFESDEGEIDIAYEFPRTNGDEFPF